VNQDAFGSLDSARIPKTKKEKEKVKQNQKRMTLWWLYNSHAYFGGRGGGKDEAEVLRRFTSDGV